MSFIYNNTDYELQLCRMQGSATVRYFDCTILLHTHRWINVSSKIVSH